MNWKRFTICITIVNLLGWALIELWSWRYATSNVNIGAGVLIVVHMLGYYIASINSNLPPEPKEVSPTNCPGHDWQIHPYSVAQQRCVRCGAQRGITK